jgi:hypothetical protein
LENLISSYNDVATLANVIRLVHHQ